MRRADPCLRCPPYPASRSDSFAQLDLTGRRPLASQGSGAVAVEISDALQRAAHALSAVTGVAVDAHGAPAGPAPPAKRGLGVGAADLGPLPLKVAGAVGAGASAPALGGAGGGGGSETETHSVLFPLLNRLVLRLCGAILPGQLDALLRISPALLSLDVTSAEGVSLEHLEAAMRHSPRGGSAAAPSAPTAWARASAPVASDASGSPFTRLVALGVPGCEKILARSAMLAAARPRRPQTQAQARSRAATAAARARLGSRGEVLARTGGAFGADSMRGSGDADAEGGEDEDARASGAPAPAPAASFDLDLQRPLLQPLPFSGGGSRRSLAATPAMPVSRLLAVAATIARPGQAILGGGQGRPVVDSPLFAGESGNEGEDASESASGANPGLLNSQLRTEGSAAGFEAILGVAASAARAAGAHAAAAGAVAGVSSGLLLPFALARPEPGLGAGRAAARPRTAEPLEPPPPPRRHLDSGDEGGTGQMPQAPPPPESEVRATAEQLLFARAALFHRPAGASGGIAAGGALTIGGPPSGAASAPRGVRGGAATVAAAAAARPSPPPPPPVRALGFEPIPGACFLRESALLARRIALERIAADRVRKVTRHGLRRPGAREWLWCLRFRVRVRVAARLQTSARRIQRAYRAHLEICFWKRHLAATVLAMWFRRVLFIDRCRQRVLRALEVRRAAQVKQLSCALLFRTLDRVLVRQAWDAFRLNALVERWRDERRANRLRGLGPVYGADGKLKVQMAFPALGDEVLGAREEMLEQVRRRWRGGASARTVRRSLTSRCGARRSTRWR